MKILELFSGYGTASFALKRITQKYELVGYSDIDKYANQIFKQNHCPKDIDGKLMLGDATKINPKKLQDFDLLTAGFNCQPFSAAGKMLGEDDPRGQMFYEIIRIAEVKQPKMMLLENVKGFTYKKFEKTFQTLLSELDRIGYTVYWKVLNSKDYGIPQSRARVWFVCYRKDIKHEFSFPEPTELKIFIKDILEDEVDKKYYLSPLLQERFDKYLKDKQEKNMAKQKKDILSIGLLTQTYMKRINDTPIEINEYFREKKNNPMGWIAEQIGIPKTQLEHYFRLDSSRAIPSPEIYEKLKIELKLDDRYDKLIKEFAEKEVEYEQTRRVYDAEGVSPTINTIKEPMIYDRKGFDSRTKGFRESVLCPTLSKKMGTGGNNVPMVVNAISTTLTTAVGRIGHSSEELRFIENNMMSGKLRRLTPKECFRLQGFLNDEINMEGISDSQLYRLAGNGQDVNMVSLIFKKMFEGLL